MSEKKRLTRESVNLTDQLPVKVIQFGEGNFLRAFVDYAFQVLNRTAGYQAGVAVVQPIEHGMAEVLREQDGLYTLFLQGIEKGIAVRKKELINNIVQVCDPYKEFDSYLSLAHLESLEFVISNTTEAGIAYNEEDHPEMQPPSSFPAKLTRFLYERFTHFNGVPGAGLTIIPCELINYNSDTLLKIILRYIDQWNLEDGFRDWVNEYCDFHNTLVDRIVPGYPADRIHEYEEELNYEDKLIVSAETYFLWVIEGEEELKKKLPFDQTELNVRIVNDMQPYRTRKVRILNGSHTAMVPFSLLYGNSTVKETVDNEFTGDFIRKLVFNEIVPELELDHEELTGFAGDVFDRFRNPYIEHRLSSIALNSISKFKVRVLPSLLDYVSQRNEMPVRLVYAMACLFLFYRGEWNGRSLPVSDEEEIKKIMSEAWESSDTATVVNRLLRNTRLWDQDLTRISLLAESLTRATELIIGQGVEKGFAEFKKFMKEENKKLTDHV